MDVSARLWRYPGFSGIFGPKSKKLRLMIRVRVRVRQMYLATKVPTYTYLDDDDMSRNNGTIDTWRDLDVEKKKLFRGSTFIHPRIQHSCTH